MYELWNYSYQNIIYKFYYIQSTSLYDNSNKLLLLLNKWEYNIVSSNPNLQ